ncbi:MAG: phage holin family protein [Myxococcota bacterium]|nr:phage holin family protein [Myxococcota bacterium]
MATNDVAKASIPELISGLVGDAKDMAAGHATKARAEIKEEFNGLKQYLMMVLVSIGLGIMGAILLSQAFALGLAALGVPMWAGYLIAAVIFVGIGYALIKRMPSNKDHIDLIPENAIAGIKRDVQEIKDDVQDEVKAPGRPVPAH